MKIDRAMVQDKTDSLLRSGLPRLSGQAYSIEIPQEDVESRGNFFGFNQGHYHSVEEYDSTHQLPKI